jgi:hypothetical protein
MHRFRVAASIAVVSAALAAVAPAASASTASRHTSAARVATSASVAVGRQLRNPARNIAPHPNFFGVCAEKGHNSSACITEELAAIRNARSHEHMRRHAFTLPNNYTKLTVTEQTFVVTNIERVDRGLKPIVGLTSRLNLASHLAAVLRVDPTISNLVARLLHITSWGSIWAGDLGPLASDYDWMYEDGYSGSNSINIACRTRRARGCWGHRENILHRFGSGQVVVGGAGSANKLGTSIAELIAGGYSHPHYVFTWAQALAHGANGHRATAR